MEYWAAGGKLMSSATRMEYGCPHCPGRFAQDLPTGARKEQARYAVVLELRNPELAGRCLELHLHGWYCGEEHIQTVRLAIDPQSRETRSGAPTGVRIIALYEKPPEWPAIRTVRGSRLPGEEFVLNRLTVGACPEFCYDVPPDSETSGGDGTLVALVPITAMWTYPVPTGR